MGRETDGKPIHTLRNMAERCSDIQQPLGSDGADVGLR